MKQDRAPAHSDGIQAVSDLAIVAGHPRPKTLIIAGGDREDDLRLVESARDHGIVSRCILVGAAEGILNAAALANIDVPDRDIIATDSPEQTAARTVEYTQRGDVDIILKGNVPTPILNRAMLGIAARQTISLVTVFDTATVANGRPLLLTDPGVTTVCTFGRMLGLVQNAVDVARSVLGRETFLTCELMQEGRSDFAYFLAGSPSELDPVLARLKRRGLITDMVYSVLGI